MLSEVELIQLNSRGLFPMQDEEEKAFLSRIALLEKEKKQIPPVNVQEALTRCEKLFCLKPDWVPIEEKQISLAPWQGAVLWIQEDRQGNRVPLIQISPRLKSSWLSRWYPQDEVLSHELVHAVRLPLRSSRFEEIAAYQTSKSRFRRFLGPIFRRPYEVFVLLLAVVIGWLSLFWSAAAFLVWVPWFVCFFGAARLLMTQFVFKRCRAKMQIVLKERDKALALCIRLTDKEIGFFARSSPQEIISYIYRAKSEQLRWRMLCTSFLFKDIF